MPLITEMTNDPQQQTALKLIVSRQTMARPYVAPPGVPADRLQALRAAFDATMNDPAFLAEAKRQELEVRPVSGAQAEVLIKEIYATPPEIVIELDKASRVYHFVGTRAGTVSADRLSMILDILPSLPPGLTVEEVHERWPDDGAGQPLLTPGVRSIRRELDQATEVGTVKFTGSGRRHDPFRYYYPRDPLP